MDHIEIFDTTLRDGEQSPGIVLDLEAKVAIARQLERLGVDVIEAGFPAASDGDRASVSAVAAAVTAPVVCALSRTADTDIDAAWAAVAGAVRPRLHVFIATSELHMAKKLRMSRAQVLDEIGRGITRARSLCDDVEFSPEDGFRSEREFLYQALAVAVDAGATVLNIPDTVGYATPAEYGALMAAVRVHVDGEYRLSTHCHDDLGLAVANSLAGVANGATQIECAMNGIGERAGNAALEEVVMALALRAEALGGRTSAVVTRELWATSRLVADLTGYAVPPNKAVVGANAFAHESGIHQHGVLADRATYEIIDAEAVGQQGAQLVLGKHSGRHAFARTLAELGVALSGEALNAAFGRFKELADRKVEITDADLLALVGEAVQGSGERWTLVQLEFASAAERDAHDEPATAAVTIAGPDGSLQTATGTGTGVVDAAAKAIGAVCGIDAALVEYRVDAVTGGLDALAAVTVTLQAGTGRGRGRGVANDVVEASARAYLAAMNRLAGTETPAPA